ncbi:MAG: hypothetical protein R3F19_23520 [Verrucomicrobiales bacterium]
MNAPLRHFIALHLLVLCAGADELLPVPVPELDGLRREGPRLSMLGDDYVYRDTTGTVVGKLLIRRGVRKGDVVLDLYDPGWVHRSSRKWRSGKLVSEETYSHGVRHGLWRTWNKKGELVGATVFEKGNGVQRIYYNDGSLEREIPFVEDKEHGIVVYLHENRQIRELYWYENGTIVREISFDAEGKLVHTAWSNEKGVHGSYLNGDGEFELSLNGRQVSTDDYREAAKSDANLPPFFANGKECIEFVMSDQAVLKLSNHYKELDLVKIPLEELSQGKAD